MRDTICLSIGVQIVILPICIQHFHYLPIGFLISNIVASIFFSSSIKLIILLLMVSIFSDVFGQVIALGITWFVQSWLQIIEKLAQIPWMQVDCICFSTMELIGYVLFLFLFWCHHYFYFQKQDTRITKYRQKAIETMKKVIRKRGKVLFICCIFLLIVSLGIHFFYYRNKPCKIYFIDVGQRRLFFGRNTKWKNNFNRWRRGIRRV